MTGTNKKILIVGGGGFIGGHLVNRLLNDGNSIVASDIKPKEYWFQDFDNGFWFDEWTTLWFSNINFSLGDQEYWSYLTYTVHGAKGSEGTTKLVFFILQSYFHIFGYYAENAKIFF